MSQKKLVIEQLTTEGYITRNWCLQRYISRLGAIICTLKKEGWNFETEDRDGDYIYWVKENEPVKPITFNHKKELETLEQKPLFNLRPIYD